MESVIKIFTLMAAIPFALAILTYVSCALIVRNTHPTMKTIRTRRILVVVGAYVLATGFCALIPLVQSIWPSFVGEAFGADAWSSKGLDEKGFYSLLRSFMSISLLVTTVLFISVGIIRKLVSPIRTSKDLEGMVNYILYLRSFQSDNAIFERRLNKILGTIAPIYAVGDPGKLLQPVGATRVYFPDQEWKESVKRMCETSRFIVMRIGQSEGTQWEMENIMKNELVDKTLFLILNETDYSFLKTKFSEYDLPSLPDGPFEHPIALFFDGGWQISEMGDEKQTAEIAAAFMRGREDLAAYYAQHVRVSRHPFLHLFDKDIPRSVRLNPYWNILSPVIAMRHWGWQGWGLFLLSIIISLIIGHLSMIPICAVILFLFFFGRRIEWLQTVSAGERPFNRRLRREFLLMLYSAILGLAFCVFYCHLMQLPMGS